MTPRISSHCHLGNCVAVSPDGNGTGVYVQHSDLSRGPRLWFSDEEWRAFVLGAREGEFDLDALAEPQHPAPGLDALAVSGPAKPQLPLPEETH